MPHHCQAHQPLGQSGHFPPCKTYPLPKAQVCSVHGGALRAFLAGEAVGRIDCLKEHPPPRHYKNSISTYVTTVGSKHVILHASHRSNPLPCHILFHHHLYSILKSGQDCDCSIMKQNLHQRRLCFPLSLLLAALCVGSLQQMSKDEHFPLGKV